MKVVICLASFIAVASAGHLAAVNTGASSQYRTQDNLGQYSFGYDEAGATGGSFRHEKSDALGNRIGSYGLRGADGRVRIVNYVADANGYRASVQTNEPGTESRDTAAVSVNRAPTAIEPAPVAAAPLHVAAAPIPLTAPLAVPAPILQNPAYGHASVLTAPLGYGFSAINHHLAPLPAY